MTNTTINQTARVSFEADLAHARTLLEGWRATRKRGERIPGAIWEAVIPLARVHGVNPVSSALHLEYSVLKRRLGSAEPPVGDSADGKLPKFVELKLPASHAPASECRIEMEDASGARMSVKVALGSPSDVAALLEAFWRGRS